MYARVTPSRLPEPGKREEARHLIDEVVVPALRQLPGFRGYLALADPAADRGLAITLWDTREQAETFRSTAAAREVLTKAEALGYRFETPETYEVIRQV
jgi:heme-degrading monooxygenase HmoA